MKKQTEDQHMPSISSGSALYAKTSVLEMIQRHVSTEGMLLKTILTLIFCLFDSLRTINNLSVIKGWVFLG